MVYVSLSRLCAAAAVGAASGVAARLSRNAEREREAAFDYVHTCNASLCMRQPPLLGVYMYFFFFFFCECEAIEMDLARFYRFDVPLYSNKNAHRSSLSLTTYILRFATLRGLREACGG